MKIAEIEKKVDRIIVDNREYKKICQFWKGKSSTEYMNKRMFFPLKTFAISIEILKGVYLKALIELDTFNPTSGRITTDDGWFTFKRDYVRGGTQFDGHLHTTSPIPLDKKIAQEYTSDVHTYIMGVLVYICNKGREITEKERQERKQRDPEEKKEYNPYEFKDRECFLLNQIIQYVGEHPTRKSIQYQCECWGVRGHIRHKANGNIEFVHPYKKGRKRDVLEPKSKTYLLGGAE